MARRRCRGLPYTKGCSYISGAIWTVKSMPFFCACISISICVSFSYLIRSKGSWLSTSPPSSILDISSTSLIRESRWLAEMNAFSRLLFRNPISFSCFLSISSRPMIPFSGVRISWDIRERKLDFSALARSAVSRASLRSFWCLISDSTTSSTFKNPRTMIPKFSFLIKRNW